MPRFSGYPAQSLSSWMLKDTFLQERKTLTADGAGGFTVGWTEVNTALPGVLTQSPRMNEEERGAKGVAGITHTFFTYPDSDVQRGDRLSITKEGRTHIVAVMGLENPAMMNHHLEANCKEFEPGLVGVGQDEEQF